MPVSFDMLQVGQKYDRRKLAAAWGYASWEAIGRGIITPRGDNKMVLFVTKEKRSGDKQYRDHLEGTELYMEGEDGHRTDQRLARSAASRDEVHLFYREQHHEPFTYHGRVHLKRADLREGQEPSHFVFDLAPPPDLQRVADEALQTEQLTHGNEEFVPDPEGKRKLRQHATYERSPRNRARAIQVHGTICKACGFDFNRVYGEDLAKSYIEIHHVKSITEVNSPVNPDTDLVPLCSNCHSMAHKPNGRILTWQELAGIVNARRGNRIHGS